MDIVYAQMDSPVGPLRIASTRDGICKVSLDAGGSKAFFTWLSEHVGPHLLHEDPQALHTALTQLRGYFAGDRREFDLALDVRGTAFQRAAWAEVARVPYGQTATYGEIAHRLGRPNAARPVGAAVGANPIPIIIPCHRVIGAGGSLTGYGAGLDVKVALLELEGAYPL